MSTIEEDITTLHCWGCKGAARMPHDCPKCSGTGMLFWAGGYAFPYTPEGEKRARETLKERR